MMAGLPDFRHRQTDLSKRLGRQHGRTLVRRRLERELQNLVVAELQAELRKRPEPVPEFPEEEGHELQWFQK